MVWMCPFLSLHSYNQIHLCCMCVLLLFGRSVPSNPLQPHGLQHPRPPCPSPSLRVCSNSCPLSRWCHPTNSSSVIPLCVCIIGTSLHFICLSKRYHGDSSEKTDEALNTLFLMTALFFHWMYEPNAKFLHFFLMANKAAISILVNIPFQFCSV